MALTKVGKGGLDKGSIKDQTNLGAEAADTDEFLLYDASADDLKAIQSQNVVGPGIITNKTSLGEGAATGDQILVYDISAGALKKVTQQNFLNFPTVSSVSPTNLTSGDGTGNYTVVITGSGFTGATAKLLKSDNATEVAFDSQTVDSDTQITGVIAKSSLSNADEDFGVKVQAATGLTSSLNQQISIDAQPIFSTAAGSLGTVADSSRASTTFTVAAADPESGGDVTYTLESGSLPAGCSLTSTSSGAVITGFNAVSTNTTSTFTIRAKDVNSNTNDREFSITVNAPVQQSFTSSGTFSVPSGLTSVDVLVVAGGGAGGIHHAGGGGAGGLIYRPGFPVTPGGSVSVTVGDGANPEPSPGPVPHGGTQGDPGQDSVFGTLTAKGGGGGGSSGPESPAGKSGGSGGGRSGPGSGSAGTATQPTQPGDSGNYGFGNDGGGGPDGPQGAGGGGAGGAGQPAGSAGPNIGAGGVGKAYTIGDGTTSVYYAGGGGGGAYQAPGQGGTGGQGGGGRGSSTAPPGNPVAQNATSGTANRGGGGGGSDRGTPSGGGGKGIVIVSY